MPCRRRISRPETPMGRPHIPMPAMAPDALARFMVDNGLVQVVQNEPDGHGGTRFVTVHDRGMAEREALRWIAEHA